MTPSKKHDSIEAMKATDNASEEHVWWEAEIQNIAGDDAFPDRFAAMQRVIHGKDPRINELLWEQIRAFPDLEEVVVPTLLVLAVRLGVLHHNDIRTRFFDPRSFRLGAVPILQQIDDPRALTMLEEYACGEVEPLEREEENELMIEAIRALGTKGAVAYPTFVKILEDRSTVVREEAAAQLRALRARLTLPLGQSRASWFCYSA
jgi:hypothetical protein